MRNVLIALGLALAANASHADDGIKKDREDRARPYLMEYNVENLFDLIVTGNEYPYFGEDYITKEHYLQKVMNVERVIEASGCPRIVALMEIESAAALDMVRPNCEYTTKLFAGPPTWIGVAPALLTSEPVLYTATVWPMLAGKSFRPMLKVIFEDRTTVYLAHWKSQMGVEYMREASAEAIVNDIAATHVDGRVIVVGDLNEETGAAIDRLIAAGFSDCTGQPTYHYNGKWYAFDHVLMTEGCTSKTKTMDHPFLLDSAGIPLRWDKEAGTGFSDHLPILLPR